MTDRTELKRQIAELQAFLSRIADFPQKLRAPIEAAIAELQAQLAAMDAEPDWGAWKPAVGEWRKARGLPEILWDVRDDLVGCPRVPSALFKDTVRGLIAALPLAPRAAMDDAAVELLARECCAEDYEGKGLMDAAINYRSGEYNAESDTELRIAIAAIRATLSRVPAAAWPGDAELREMASQSSNQLNGFKGPYEVALEMARRLKAHMTGGAA
jgi:hypothetical protein